MEKQPRLLTRREALKLGGAVVGGIFASAIVATVDAEPPYVWKPIGAEAFAAVKPPLDAKVIPSAPPSPEQTKQPSKTELKVMELKSQRDEILRIAQNSGKFSADLLDDLHDNLPFYLAAGEKYNVDWEVLWIIHEAESGASDPKSMAFDPSRADSQIQGSWQINISWGEDFAHESFEGLEYTKAFKQRHQGDAVGAAEAAHMLRRNMDQYKDLGPEKALFDALSLYCGAEQAAIRMDKIKKVQKIFIDEARIESSLAKKPQ